MLRPSSRRFILVILICASSLVPFLLWRRPSSEVSRPARRRTHYSVRWHNDSAVAPPMSAMQPTSVDPPVWEVAVAVECDVLSGRIREPGGSSRASPRPPPKTDRARFVLQHSSRAWVAEQVGLLHSWAGAPAIQSRRRRNSARAHRGAPVPAFLTGLRQAVGAGSAWPLSALVPLPSAVLAPCSDREGAGPPCPDTRALLRAHNSTSVWDVFGLHPRDAIQVAAYSPGSMGPGISLPGACSSGPAIGRRVVFEVDTHSASMLAAAEVGLIKRALVRACARLAGDVASRLTSTVHAAGAVLVGRINAGGEAALSPLNGSRVPLCPGSSNGTLRRVAVSIRSSDADALEPAARARARDPRLSPHETATLLARAVASGIINASSLARRLSFLPDQPPPPAVLPHGRMDERYALELHQTRGVGTPAEPAAPEYVVSIVSPTVWGALRGLVTAVDLAEGWALPAQVQAAPALALADALLQRCPDRLVPQREEAVHPSLIPSWLSTDLKSEARRLAASVFPAVKLCSGGGESSWLPAVHRAVAAVGLTASSPGLEDRLPLFIADAPLCVREKGRCAVFITSSSVHRRRWRGLLLDVARTFFLPADVRTLLDTLEAHKASVLHLHLSDAQAWPLDLRSLPELGRSGAWSTDRIYSAADLAGFVAYAADRGIRVVPELDLPSHSFALAAAPAFRPFFSGCVDNQAGRIVGLGRPCYTRGARDPAGRGGDRGHLGDFAARDMPGPIAGVHEATNIGVCLRGKATIALDPSRRGALEVVAAAIAELAALFPDAMFHVGADEVDLDCFGDADTDAWARAHLQGLVGQAARRDGGGSMWSASTEVVPSPVTRTAALAFFLRSVTRVVGALGKQSMTWSDSRLDLEDRGALFADRAARGGGGSDGSGTCAQPGCGAPTAVFVRSTPLDNTTHMVGADAAVTWNHSFADLIDSPRVINSVVSEGVQPGGAAPPHFTPLSLLRWLIVAPVRAAWRAVSTLVDLGVSAVTAAPLAAGRPHGGAAWGDSLASFASPGGVGLQSWRCSSHRLECDLVAVLRDDVWRAHAAALGAGAPTWAEETAGADAPRFAARGAPTSVPSLRPLLQSACWYLDGADSWARLHTISGEPRTQGSGVVSANHRVCPSLSCSTAHLCNGHGIDSAAAMRAGQARCS